MQNLKHVMDEDAQLRDIVFGHVFAGKREMRAARNANVEAAPRGKWSVSDKAFGQ